MLDKGECVCVHAVEEAAFFAAHAARHRGLPVVYDMQSSIAEQLSEHWLFGLAPLRLPRTKPTLKPASTSK
jgi:hypothetical protein